MFIMAVMTGLMIIGLCVVVNVAVDRVARFVRAVKNRP